MAPGCFPGRWAQREHIPVAFKSGMLTGLAGGGPPLSIPGPVTGEGDHLARRGNGAWRSPLCVITQAFRRTRASTPRRGRGVARSVEFVTG